MTIKKVGYKIKKLFGWIIGDEDVITEICEAFTIVTVINSFMMISGLDKPKTGRFAYIHLLIRLTIISVVVVLWDDQSIIVEIKEHIRKIKNINGTYKMKMRKIYKNVLENKYQSICIVYTVITVIICLVMISGIYVSKGGVELYFNLILLFAFISITVLILYIFETLKSLSQQNRKL